MRKILSIMVAALTLLGSQTALASFTDVKADFHQYNSINWLQEQKVVEGYKDGSYKPEQAVSRAEFLKMLYETIGMNGENPTLPFSDVPNDEWYTKYVKEAYATGVIKGYEDGSFKPDSEISLAEALKIVGEAFFDIDYLYDNDSEFKYCPTGSLDFDQLLSSENQAKIDQADWYWKYVYVTGELCVFDFGLNAYGVGGLWMNSYVDRGDMAELLYRAKTAKDNGAAYSSELKPNSLTPAEDEIAFDGCGTLGDYEDQPWFADLEAKYAAGDYMEDSVGAPYGKACLALDKSLFILIPSDFAQAHGCGGIFKYDIANATLEEAPGDYCAVDFGLRVGAYIKFNGFANDGGAPCKNYDGKYYYKENTVDFSTSAC